MKDMYKRDGLFVPWRFLAKRTSDCFAHDKLYRFRRVEDEIWENEVDGGRIVRDWVRSKDDSDRYYVSFRANESVGEASKAYHRE